MLYIVATPIGNLSDISFRAIETLKGCDFIIAENPRSSSVLLNHYQITGKPVHQFAEHNEQKVLGKLVEMLKSQNGCLITDAGTPGISDPGFRLVRECSKEGINIIPIPGASAVIAALSASGLPTDRFMFLGFIPRTQSKVTKAIQMGKDTESTIIFYDSPFRVTKTVEIIANAFPESNVVVTRELTKIHEEFIRGNATVVAEELKKKKIKGEITVLVSFK